MPFSRIVSLLALCFGLVCFGSERVRAEENREKTQTIEKGASQEEEPSKNAVESISGSDIVIQEEIQLERGKTQEEKDEEKERQEDMSKAEREKEAEENDEKENFVKRVMRESTLTLSAFTQFRYSFNDSVDELGDTEYLGGFNIPRTRIYFMGWLTKYVSFLIRTGFVGTGNFSLEQAYGNFNFTKNLQLRVGQFAIALFREGNVAAQRSLSLDSSPSSIRVAAGQSQGFQFRNQSKVHRVSFAFSNGLRTGYSEIQDPFRADYAFTGRVARLFGAHDWKRTAQFTSFPGSQLMMLLGGAVHWQSGGHTSSSEDKDLLVMTGDVSFFGDGWNALVQASWARVYRLAPTALDWAQILVQGGFFFTRSTELFSRYDLYLPDHQEGGVTNDMNSLTGGINQYLFGLGHRVKASADFIYFFNAQASSGLPVDELVGLFSSHKSGQWSARAQIQLSF